MAAGHAGLSRLFTAAAAEELFRRGERLRDQLNAVCQDAGAPMQWTGLGSLLTVHFQTRPIRSAADIEQRPQLRELFHLDLLERGFYLARRGMLALSLEIGDDECESLCAAVADFVAERRDVLPREAERV
jgi:glutamate-1-semialdehyde 2,1-aminomutase